MLERVELDIVMLGFRYALDVSVKKDRIPKTAVNAPEATHKDVGGEKRRQGSPAVQIIILRRSPNRIIVTIVQSKMEETARTSDNSRPAVPLDIVAGIAELRILGRVE